MGREFSKILKGSEQLSVNNSLFSVLSKQLHFQPYTIKQLNKSPNHQINN